MLRLSLHLFSLPALFPLLILLSLLASCSLDIEKEAFSEELSTEIPNTVMHVYRQVLVEDGRKKMELSAQKVEGYDQEKKLIMEELSFTEYDREGEVLHTGEAGRAVNNYGDKKVLLEKEVFLESINRENRVEVEGESFTWYEGEHLIEAPPGEPVRFSYGNEGSLQGRGFSARTDTGLITFTGGAKGLFNGGEER